jgi:hypothetical protein
MKIARDESLIDKRSIERDAATIQPKDGKVTVTTNRPWMPRMEA